MIIWDLHTRVGCARIEEGVESIFRVSQCNKNAVIACAILAMGLLRMGSVRGGDGGGFGGFWDPKIWIGLLGEDASTLTVDIRTSFPTNISSILEQSHPGYRTETRISFLGVGRLLSKMILVGI